MKSRQLLCYLFVVFLSGVVFAAEPPAVTETPDETAPQTELPPKPSQTTSNTPSVPSLPDFPVWEPPKGVLDASATSDGSHQSKNKFDFNKPLGVHFVQKFANWFRPVYEKWSRFKDFLAYPDHPNHNGGVAFDPQEVWEKWHEKGHHFLTGINGAIYGLSPNENHDYPFAYRRLLGSTKKEVNRSKRHNFDLD